MPRNPNRDEMKGATRIQMEIGVAPDGKLTSEMPSDMELQTILTELYLAPINEELYEAFRDAERVGSPEILLEYFLDVTAQRDVPNIVRWTAAISKLQGWLTDNLLRSVKSSSDLWTVLEKSGADLDVDEAYGFETSNVYTRKICVADRLLLSLVLAAQLAHPSTVLPISIEDQASTESRAALASGATKLFLSLMDLPHASKTAFAPRPFPMQVLLHLLSPLIGAVGPKVSKDPEKPTIASSVPATPSKGTPRRRLMLRDDDMDADEGTTNVNEDDAARIAMQVFKIFGYWLETTDAHQYLSEVTSREVMLLVVDKLAAIFNSNITPFMPRDADKHKIKRTSEGYRHAAIKSLMRFIIHVGKHCRVDDNDENADSCRMVPLAENRPSGDLLMVVAGLVLRHFVTALAMGGKKIGTTMVQPPREFVVAQLEVFDGLKEVVAEVPALLAPDKFKVSGPILAHQAVTEEHQKPKLEKQEASDDESVLMSDDEEYNVKEKEKKTAASKKKRNVDVDLSFSVRDPVLGFLSNGLMSVPDRKDWRDRLCGNIMKVLEHVDTVEVLEEDEDGDNPNTEIPVDETQEAEEGEAEREETEAPAAIDYDGSTKTSVDMAMDHFPPRSASAKDMSRLISRTEKLPFRWRIVLLTCRMLYSDKVVHRIVALDLAQSLLTEKEEPGEMLIQMTLIARRDEIKGPRPAYRLPQSANFMKEIWMRTEKTSTANLKMCLFYWLWILTLRMCVDSQPTVRAKAFECLAGILTSCRANARWHLLVCLLLPPQALQPILSTHGNKILQSAQKDLEGTSTINPFSSKALLAAPSEPLCGLQERQDSLPLIDIATLAIYGMTDEKTVVQKSALTFLEEAFRAISEYNEFVGKEVRTSKRRRSTAEKMDAAYDKEEEMGQNEGGEGLHKVSLAYILQRPPQQMLLTSQLNPIPPRHAIVTVADILRGLAQEFGIQVRQRAVITAHSLLLAFPSSPSVYPTWTSVVLPAIVDVETGVQDKVLELVVDKLILGYLQQELVKLVKEKGSEVKKTLPGGSKSSSYLYLHFLSGFDRDSRDFVGRIVQQWIKKNGPKSLPKGFFSLLEDALRLFLESGCSLLQWPSALFLLSGELCNALNVVARSGIDKLVPASLGDLMQQLFFMVKDLEWSSATDSIMTAIHVLMPLRPQKARQQLASSLMSLIEEKALNIALITPVIRLLARLDAGSIQTSWQDQIIKNVQADLGVILRMDDSTTCLQHPHKLSVLMTTLGELCLIRPKVKIHNTSITVLQALVTNTLHVAVKRSKQTGENESTLDSSGISLPSNLRALAAITLGKICLTNEQTARKNIEILIGHVGEKENDIVVRLNCLVALCDLCLHYTSIVDQHMPSIALCLCEKTAPSSLLRKQSLGLLASLVANDYVKLRGPLMYRFIMSLGDEDHSVRTMAEAIFKRVVLQKIPNFVQTTFVQAMCVLNGWYVHPSFVVATQLNAASMRGPHQLTLQKEPWRRQQILSFLLIMATDSDKHEISKKIVHSFLAPFVDAPDEMTDAPSLPLPKSAKSHEGSALQDALNLLGCKQLKITFGEMAKQKHAELSAGGVQDGEDEAEKRQAYEQALLKRNLAVQVIPTLLSLKRLMEKKQSPFLRDMLRCLGALLYDYRSELQSLLVNDAVLAKQLELEFKRGQHRHYDLQLVDPHQLAEMAQAHFSSTATRDSALLATSPCLTGAGTAALLPPGGIPATTRSLHETPMVPRGQGLLSSVSRNVFENMLTKSGRGGLPFSAARLTSERITRHDRHSDIGLKPIVDEDLTPDHNDVKQSKVLSTIHSVASPGIHDQSLPTTPQQSSRRCQRNSLPLSAGAPTDQSMDSMVGVMSQEVTDYLE